MVAAGFAPLLSRLSEVDSSLRQTLGGICRLLPVVAFLHVFLAYPDGRLAPRLERPLVIAGYTSVLGFSFAAMFLGPTNVDSVGAPDAQLLGVRRGATSSYHCGFRLDRGYAHRLGTASLLRSVPRWSLGAQATR
jgi:hypothetical protein